MEPGMMRGKNAPGRHIQIGSVVYCQWGSRILPGIPRCTHASLDRESLRTFLRGIVLVSPMSIQVGNNVPLYTGRCK